MAMAQLITFKVFFHDINNHCRRRNLIEKWIIIVAVITLIGMMMISVL